MLINLLTRFLSRLNEVEVRGILLAQASPLALALALASALVLASASVSTLALMFHNKVFVEVYSSAPRAPSFAKLGVHILRYLKSHILASLEQVANDMHE